MTGNSAEHKSLPHSRRVARRSARADRYAARAVLWSRSSLPRLRACGLHHQGSQADPLHGGQTPREPVVTLRVSETASEGRRASWSGVQSCGSTWACPVCSERIQAQRNADVAAALAVARARGWVVGFLTFTVRHRRRHGLADVWGRVGSAWRASTSGSRSEWERDRREFGIVGYLRLVEVTHGANGWHVHVHALVFLDPAGRTTPIRVRAEGPDWFPVLGPVRVADTDYIGPLTQAQAHPLDPWLEGPLLEGQRRTERIRPPLVTVGYAADRCEHVKACSCPTPRAERNYDDDRRAGRPDARRGLYLRDVEDLGARMGARWVKDLAGSAFEPSTEHGYDARLVTDARDLAGYFAKNVYAVKTEQGAAFDVTSSFGKDARQGNVTPFGILHRIATAPERVDEATGELIREPSRRDLALWYEWERVSLGKRQLLWSNGLRELLGLGVEVDDEQAAAAEDEGMVEGVEVAPQVYRRLARSGVAPLLMAAAEQGSQALRVALLEHRVPFRWADPPDPERRAAAWAAIGYQCQEVPPGALTA